MHAAHLMAIVIVIDPLFDDYIVITGSHNYSGAHP